MPYKSIQLLLAPWSADLSFIMTCCGLAINRSLYVLIDQIFANSFTKYEMVDHIFLKHMTPPTKLHIKPKQFHHCNWQQT